MKIITDWYRKLKLSQQVYNPDLGEFENFNDENYDIFNPQEYDDPEGLPILTEDDFGKRVPLADNTDIEEEIQQDDIRPIDADQDDFPEFTSQFQAMKYAINNQELVRIHYICKGGTYIIRDVEPHGWFKARTTNNIIVVTWDRTVGWYRGFIPDHIQKYEWWGEEFVPRFQFRVERDRLLGRLRQRKSRRKKKWVNTEVDQNERNSPEIN